MFAGENRPAYDRVHLSALFDDQTPEILSVPGGGTGQPVTLHLNDEEIDRDHKTVITAGGVGQATTPWCWPPVYPFAADPRPRPRELPGVPRGRPGRDQTLRRQRQTWW